MINMYKNDPIHISNIFILVLIVITISILGLYTLKNTSNTQTSIVYLTPTPRPTFSFQQPVSTGEVGMTLQEAQQQIPPPPSGLTAIQLPDGLQLQWSANRGNIIRYNIYRAEEGGKSHKIDSKTAQEEIELKTNGQYEFIDTTVQNGTTYTYTITATNIYNNESDSSEAISVKYETLITE